MWVLGPRQIPHTSHNTNTIVESYYFNLISILNSTKERFVGHRMDWLNYHLMSDIVTYYWYGVQCKAFGFIRKKTNKKGLCVQQSFAPMPYPTQIYSFALMRLLRILSQWTTSYVFGPSTPWILSGPNATAWLPRRTWSASIMLRFSNVVSRHWRQNYSEEDMH